MSEPTRVMPLVAIFDFADDVTEMLVPLLEARGFRTVSGRMGEIQSGTLDLVAFLDEQDPQVILFDLPRPCERHLNFLRLLATADPLKRRAWVLMTTDGAALRLLLRAAHLQPWVVGKPYLPKTILRAVRTASEGRTTGGDA